MSQVALTLMLNSVQRGVTLQVWPIEAVEDDKAMALHEVCGVDVEIMKNF